MICSILSISSYNMLSNTKGLNSRLDKYMLGATPKVLLRTNGAVDEAMKEKSWAYLKYVGAGILLINHINANLLSQQF